MENIIFAIMVIIMFGAGGLTLVYESGGISKKRKDDIMNEGKEGK